MYGGQLISHVIDRRAQDGHQRPYACIPRSSVIEDGVDDISYGRFANVINRAAHWLSANFITTPGRNNVVMYMGPFDLRYQILAMAAVKSGHVMFFPSPRNSPEALQILLRDAGCVYVLTTAPVPRPVQQVLDRSAHFQHVIVPELSWLLDETPVANIPLESTFEQLRYEPWLLVHTSGSTGNSKLVTVRHGSATTPDAYRAFEENEMMRYFESRWITPFPPFHIAGLIFTIQIPCFYDGTVILPPAGEPITASLIYRMHQQTHVDHYLLAPSLIGDIVKVPKYLAALKQLKGLTFSGGPLPSDIAEVVSKQTRLSPGYGATEFGSLPMKPRDSEDWQYFRFNVEQGGMDLRQTQEDPDRFELVFVRTESASLAQGVFVNFPDLDEYHTQDLFSRHPTKPGLYKYESRIGDILVLGNGENINPVPMEGAITACKEVKGCVVVGQGRLQTALLVEPADDEMSNGELVNRLQPYLAKANALCPTYGKISRDLIMKLPPGRKLPRAPKGTIQRSKAVAEFATDIDGLYAHFDDASRSAAQSQQLLCQPGDYESIRSALFNYVRQDLGINDKGVTDRDDFFALGMDSLSVINLVRAINQTFTSSTKFDTTIVYEHPTVVKLARALLEPPRPKGYSDFTDTTEEDKEAWMSMEKQYKDLVALAPDRSRQQKRDFLRSSDSAPIYQPDGGWVAWSQVLGSLLVNMNNWGLVNSFGVYQNLYQTELLSSYSPSTIAWIGTVQGALLLIVGVISGVLFDRGYFRAILISAGFTLVVALMLLSLATEYYQIMLCQGLLIGICLGLLYIPSVALVPLYFKRHRGLALGLATGGGSLGGIIYPIVLRSLIREAGLGWANRIIGFVSLASLTAAVSLIRPVGKRSARSLWDAEAFKEIPFICFLVSAFFLFAGILVPFVLIDSFASNLLPKLGQEGNTFYLVSALNAAQFIGRVASGAASDLLGPEVLLLLGEAGAALGGFCWIAVHNEAGLIAWTIFYGFVSGICATLPAAVLPYICPSMAVLGTRMGLVYAAAGVGLLIGSPAALAANGDTGGFLGAQVWTGTCCAAGAVSYVWTCREAGKQRRLYNLRKR